jgi:hypothetical protein
VLVHRAVPNLVKVVKLSFENKEVTALIAVYSEQALLELLKGVDHLKEVAMLKEETVILRLVLRNDSISRDE